MNMGEARNNHLEDQIRTLIVRQLRLKIEPEEIDLRAPLFPTLGLDSIDALELVAGLEKRFGVVIDDRGKARDVLTSVASIAAHVRSQQRRAADPNG